MLFSRPLASGFWRRFAGLDKLLVPVCAMRLPPILLKNDAPVQDVTEMLGLAKLATAQIYTRLYPLDLKRCHERYHPPG
jgi:hypothetical protein